ncbi:MAG: hypothetical protein WB680_12035, partial [Candidatus Acidiferrales bacterium]
AVTAHSTSAQIQHGSVGIIYFSENKDKIIFAADSRGMLPDGTHNDDYCKIAAPHGKFVFLTTGLGTYSGDELVGPWSNVDEIRRAYDRASMEAHTTNDDVLLETIKEWSHSVSNHLRSLYRVHPEMIVKSAQQQHGVLAKAFVGGVGNNGKMFILRTDVVFNPNLASPINAIGGLIEPCPKNYCAAGEITVEEEFINLTSDRAKQEAREWSPPKNSRRADRDIQQAIRYVQLTIQYGPVDVGGDIDALQMIPDGSIRWFAAKKNCQKD